MMECWGNGVMVYWKIPLDMEVEMFMNGPIPIKANIPLFHHSIIPCTRQKLMPQKTPLFSISCRISETLNYTISLSISIVSIYYGQTQEIRDGAPFEGKLNRRASNQNSMISFSLSAVISSIFSLNSLVISWTWS